MIGPDDDAGILSLSPSFNRFSSGKLAEIASRVVREFRQEHSLYDDNYESESETSFSQFQDSSSISRSKNPENGKIEDGEDDDFEFATVCVEPCASIISADEIFYNGQIRPTYPLFDTDLLLEDSKIDDKLTKTSRRSSLRMLMSNDREVTSRSPSYTDELEGISPETYCAWSAKDPESLRESRKKSTSTGSSRRWRLGKEMFLLLNVVGKKTNKIGNASEIKHGKVSRVGDDAVSGGEELPENQTDAQNGKNREKDGKNSIFFSQKKPGWGFL